MMQTELLTMALAQARGSNPLLQLIFPLAILAIFYFILIVPQRKQVKEHASLVDSLSKGDQVVTAGGLIGEIVSIRDDSVQLKTGTSTVVVEKSRIVRRTGPLSAAIDKK